MPNKTVDALMDAVAKLHDSVVGLRKDMEWVKKGLIGLYAGIGATIVAVVGAYLAR